MDACTQTWQPYSFQLTSAQSQMVAYRYMKTGFTLFTFHFTTLFHSNKETEPNVFECFIVSWWLTDWCWKWRLHSLTLLMGWILLFCNVSTLNQLQLTVQIKYLISWYICQTLGGLAHFKIMDRRKLQLLFQVLKGSHKMGRVNHLTIGDQVYQPTFLRIFFPEKNTMFISSRQGWTQRGWNMHKQHCH